MEQETIAGMISKFCTTQYTTSRKNGGATPASAPWRHRMDGRCDAYDEIAILAASLDQPHRQGTQGQDSQPLPQRRPPLPPLPPGDVNFIRDCIQAREAAHDPRFPPDPVRASGILRQLDDLYGPDERMTATLALPPASPSGFSPAFTPHAPGGNGTEPVPAGSAG